MAKRPIVACAVALATASCADGASSPPPAVIAAPPTPCVTTAPSPQAAAPRRPVVRPADSAVRLPPDERGKWELPDESRWHSAMEGYRSGVALDKQRPLGGAAVSFARYLNEVHNRVHPWFTDRFLEWVDKRPMGDALADARLVVRIELAIAPDGTIARMGVVKPSGVPAFDASGLEAFARIAPLPATPAELRSADGALWFQWELHRDEVYACSTMNARPFLLGP
jgi:TonB family protein